MMNHHQGNHPKGHPVVMVNVVVESVSRAEVASAGLAVVTADGLMDSMIDTVMSAAVAVRLVTPSVPIVPVVVTSAVSSVPVTQRNPEGGMPSVAVSVGPVRTISAPVMTAVAVPSRRSGKRRRQQESCDRDKSDEIPLFGKARGSRPHRRLFRPAKVACHVEPSFGSSIRRVFDASLPWDIHASRIETARILRHFPALAC